MIIKKSYTTLPNVLIASAFSFLFWPFVANAEIGDIPLIGGVYNTSAIVKHHIVKDIEITAIAARDLSLFTIGGLTLDAYILTLPLKTRIKARVITRLKNPQYTIALGYFLQHFYQQYTDTAKVDVFNKYLSRVYSEQQLQKYQHSLFSTVQKQQQPGSEKTQNTVENKEIIAALVTVYDLLFNNDDWQLGSKLPNEYQYLGNNKADIKLITKVQPIVINLLDEFSQSMDEGEFKSAINAIIDDNQPQHTEKINNKAQALTITIIDFVRLNVLKSYRQYALVQHRIDRFNDWMVNEFNDQPAQLITFLNEQNNKRYGVQIAVDGLQQGLLNALVKEKPGPFLNHVQDNIKHASKYQPKTEVTTQPKQIQQLDYLNALTTGKASDIHYLPFFKSIYQNYPTSIAEYGVSSTPTISVRNLPIILTGAKVAGKGGTGIPNFHFVDREIDRGYYFFGNDALQLDKLIVDNKTQTMFDRLRHLKTLNCNAQYDWNAQISYDGLINLAAGELSRDFGEQRCLTEIAKRAKVEKQVHQDRTELIKLINQYQKLSYWTPITKISKKQLIKDKIYLLANLAEAGMPDFVLMYVPWPDHFAHFKGPFSDEIISPTGELNRLDYWLMQLQQSYQKAGVYENTLWGMAGDHGLAQVFYTLNPETQVLAALEKDLNINFKIDKISSDEGEGPKITNAINYPSFKNSDVVVASTAGGNYMMDFFNSKQGWQQQPVYSELLSWLPNNAPQDLKPINMIKQISTRLKESLDYLVVRESRCSLQSCDIRLVAHRNQQRIDEVIKRQGDKVYYGYAENGQTIKPNNRPLLLDIDSENPYIPPLNAFLQAEKQQLLVRCFINAKVNDVSTWCHSDDWQLLSRFTPRPDSVNQLAHLYDEDRAGTVNLFPKEGIGYNTSVPGRHAGEHYLEKDAFIGFWGAPINSKTQISIAENGSLAPTIYEFLTAEEVIAGENGWGFPSLLNKLLNDKQ